ncbi:hypothetical protein SAY86_003744 [Trapa natans]|uniref:UV radiation resistance-associated gene protein n=1 Tax=Trapa natans TaxID=22666 RepID=A0AAN7RHB0_TRANT|nr:hypothetical protein SAY86_003744 [Trapa natans]
MRPDPKPDSEKTNKPHPPEKKKVIEWEDFEQELARLCSLSLALREAKERKQILHRKLESLIQVKNESLSRSNVLEEMREKLEHRKTVSMHNMSLRAEAAAEDSKKKEEELGAEVRSLLVAGTAISAARKRLQESSGLLNGQRGHLKVKFLQKMLRLRQQYMVSQVSLLYPVKISVGKTQEQELESFPSSTRSGNSSGSKPINHESLTILGLQLTMLPFTKMSFFTDKKEVQRSATALGYVGHAVLLIASYLQVPLRYPIHFGGSRSYILDNAPSIETTSSDMVSDSELSTSSKHTEFPLFLEGQDTTRAAYAVFLLNKDLEQLLNYIGEKSLGPRYVLANLKELLRRILSADYIDT